MLTRLPSNQYLRSSSCICHDTSRIIALLLYVGTVDNGNGWDSQVCPRAIGFITTCYKMRHSRLSLCTVAYICMGELPYFHDPTSSFLYSQPIQPPPSEPWLWLCRWMIPLSRHSVDRSQRASHSSTHTMVPASCFEVLRASMESRNMCVWQGVGHVRNYPHEDVYNVLQSALGLLLTLMSHR